MAVRLGVVGVGGIGQVHLDAARDAGVPVVAVADINEVAARQTASDRNIPEAFGDPQKLFESSAVDAVVIATPNAFHASLTIAALKAGKDVLVEKPMALTLAECDEMIAIAQANQRILQVGFVNRFTKVANTARAYVDAGRLGNIYHAKANYYRRRGIPGLGTWFTTKALSGGGPLIDLGVHIVDLIMHLMHFPRVTRVSGKVYANFGNRMKNYLYEEMWAGPPRYEGVCDVEDSAHGFIRFENGATLEINTAWAGNFPENSVSNLIGLFGDKGGMTFQLNGKELRIATEDSGHNVDIVPALRAGGTFDAQVKAFAESCANRTPPFATAEQGRYVQQIINALYESSERDREIEL